VDYNRAGVPLLEIVSDPDLASPEEAFSYLRHLKAILQYLDASDCNMEEGSLRCDANVSVRKAGEQTLGTKVEIKNLNSFKAVQRSLAYEIKRQAEALERGERIRQETRLWNDAKAETALMRSKEEAHDYRYFPEPDLVPFTVSPEEVEKVRASLPELPKNRIERFQREYALGIYDASVLIDDKELADYFEEGIRQMSRAGKANPKLLSNWIQTELAGCLNEARIPFSANPVSARELAGLLGLIENQTISGKIAKDVLPLMIEERKSAEAIVRERGWTQVTDVSMIETAARRVIEANPAVVEQYKRGKTQSIGFLVGQVMKETSGKANPKIANEVLAKLLT
jgi:aspartyl-tRNA(Asn)/glutamyl-tRNA(Gln) amidotransferase subunit B